MELVVGPAFKMCFMVSNFPSESSSESTMSTIAKHQSSVSLGFKDAEDNLNQVILEECQLPIIKDEMPPIEDSANFLEDARVESEESSVPSSNKTNEVKQMVAGSEANTFGGQQIASEAFRHRAR